MWKWLATVVLFIVLIAVGIMLETPRGNIVGSILLEQPSVKGKKVYNITNVKGTNARVVAYGPVTRGTYVDEDGKYRIDGLPVGKYSVYIRANGYSTKTKWNINVQEAKDAVIDLVKLRYQTPSLYLASDSRVFTSLEDPYFWFTTTAIDDVDLKLYRFDPMKFLQFDDDTKNDVARFLIGNYYYSTDDFLLSLYNEDNLVESWKRKIYYGREDYGRTSFKVDKRLKPGSYLLIVSGKSHYNDTKYEDAIWFTISDLGIVTKQDNSKLLVTTTNLETLQPVKKVNLEIYNRYKDFALISSVKTDDRGVAEILLPENLQTETSSLFIVAKDKNNLALSSSYDWFYFSDYSRVYVYTDRPIYRPEQMVYFKGIARENTNGIIKNLAGEKVKVRIEGPDGDVLKTYNLTTNQYGTYNGLIQLPRKSKLGSYSIKSIIKGENYYSYFEVAEYRKPEYKVDVIPGSMELVAGNKAKATVQANYFFGYPVTNAKVKYTVYASPEYGLQWKLLPRPQYYAFYDDWDDDDSFYYSGYDYGSSAGDIIAEGYATTDELGEAKITFDTKKINYDGSYYATLAENYKIEAEVTDISRKTSSGKASFRVVSGDYALFVDSDYYVYTPDQTVKVDVSTVSYDKKFISCPVKLELQRWEWDRNDWKYYQRETIATTKVVTRKNGKAIATFKLPKDLPTNTYRVVASSIDSSGNDIIATTSFWVSNYSFQGTSKMEKKPSIEMTLDKKIYKAGEVAKIMLVTPLKDTQVLLTVEGLKLYNYKILDMKENTKLIELPLSKKYVPNAYVSVTMVGKNKQLLRKTKVLRVSPDNNFLTVDIQPNKDKYKPAEEVKYDITVLDANKKPVEAELSIAVVDESIYSIRADYTPDIKKFFFNRKSNMVQTSHSFESSYSAGGQNKIEPKVRKNFKDTAFWKAVIRTDKNGQAQLSFKLPDNLTTWRTTVKAVTKDTKVGSSINNILVNKDIILRLALPRFYTVGDNAVLASIVHNYTDKDQNIQIKLDLPDNFKLADNDKKPAVFVDVPAQDKVRKDWHLELLKAGNVKITGWALSSKIEGDAVEQSIPILPFGVPKNTYVSGQILNDKGINTVDQALKDSIVPGSLDWTLRLSPSNASMILGSIDYLIQYPYGCTEQTMSKFMPSMIAVNVSKSLGVPLNEKARNKLPYVMEDSLDILYTNQHSDGGWGWWEHDNTNSYMTAYVLHGFKYATQSGYHIEQDRIDRGLKWLEEYLKKDEIKDLSAGKTLEKKSYHAESLDNLVYTCYVLSLYDKKNDVVLTNLTERKNKLTNEAVAYLALAYEQLKQKTESIELVDLLLNRYQDFKSFGMAESLLHKLGLSLASLYTYNDLEISAIVLRAMIKVSPEDPVVENIVTLLRERRHGNYWYNTKTTATIILALSEYIKESVKSVKTDYEVVVKLDNQEIKTVKYTQQNMFDPEMKISIPAEKVKSVNKLTIEKTGPGKFYYNSDFAYYKLYSPDEIIPADTSNGMIITKELFRLKSEVNKDGEITYKEVPFRAPAKAGEVLLVKLTVENSRDGQYMLVEDPKPSGMEVVSEDPRKKLGVNYDSDADNTYWWNYWWTHQENKDTHMAFFVTRLAKGCHIFKYLVRPEFPGVYLIRPVRAEGMYSSILSGSSPSYKLQIEE